MMRFSFRALALASAALLSLPLLPVTAQDDNQGLVDRLNRLERDLNTLQAQVYRGQGGGRPPAASGGSAGAGLSGGAYGVLDDRIGKLEQQMQDITGTMEENQHTISQLQSKLDRMQQDDEFRFKQLEDKLAAGPAAAAAAPVPGASEGDRQGPGSPPGFLGAPAAAPAGDRPAAPAAAAPLPAGKSASEQYDYAFGLLRNSDYDGATRAFQAFLDQHPKDPLAGNAAYWLGQIDYAQGHFDRAAVIFLDAYQKYPKSAKAAESLLKVGLSMGNLGKKKEACAALHRFRTEYPDASDNLKRQAAAERQKQGC